MKRLFKTCIVMLGMAAGTAAFVACGDDDSDGGGGGGKGSTTAGVLDKATGLRVKSYGNYTVYYDDKGRVDYVREGSYGRYVFSYSPNRIIYTDSYYDEEGESLTIGYNSAGYITSSSGSESWQDGNGDKGSASSSASLSYDGSGHLTKITGSGKESGVEDGERFSETWSFNYALTWRNNLLTKVVINWVEKEDGEAETETETWTFEYSNANYTNHYCQWAPSIGYFLSDLEEVAAYIGLLGEGPAMLPSSGEKDEEEYDNGKEYYHNSSYTYRYGFNDNGSISYTTVNGSRYNFTYDYAGADTSGGRTGTRSTSGVTEKQSKRAQRLNGLFRRALRQR